MNAILRFLKGDPRKIRLREPRSVTEEIRELEDAIEELYQRRDRIRLAYRPADPVLIPTAIVEVTPGPPGAVGLRRLFLGPAGRPDTFLPVASLWRD
jgi:hypothetical protein